MPATFLGATAETRVPLKADLFAPTRAGVTAAIDMVTAAIAKSGVTCGGEVRAGMPAEAHAGLYIRLAKREPKEKTRREPERFPDSNSRGSQHARRDSVG